MKNALLFFAGFLFLSFVQPQAKDSIFEAYAPLMNHTWKIESKWTNGLLFKQEKTFSWSLDHTIIEVKTMGNVAKERGKFEFGHRNQGTRAWDSQTNSMRFFEFDVFGGVTTGTVTVEHQDLVYTYEYGGVTLTEIWSPKSATQYHYTIGERSQGEWTKEYLSGTWERAD